MNKTCGECRWYDYHHLSCELGGEIAPIYCACDSFIPIKFTNGDKIIAGGMKVIAELYCRNKCSMCIYSTYEEDVGFGEAGWTCNCPIDKTCADGIEAWLNAPAESEGR